MILKGEYPSEILQTAANVQFFIPEEIEHSDDLNPHKVVYLLHGLHGNHTSWINHSMLSYYGRKYNAVFVMPDAARSFYCDLKIGRKYASYITKELPAICKKIFNISDRMEDTAIIGYSMGGFGALLLSLGNPGQYSFCGAISAACLYFKPALDALRHDPSGYLKTGAEAEELLKDLYSIYGEGLEYEHRKDVIELVKNFPADKPKPKIFSTCGTEDDLIKDNHKFRDMMINTDFDFTYEEWKGGHEWDFFNEGLKRTLEVWAKT